MKRSFYLALFSAFLIACTFNTVSAVSNTAAVKLSAPEEVRGSAVINTLPLSVTSICEGSAIVIDFTTTGASFDVANTFIAQLSDATGSFDTPTEIGSFVLGGDVIPDNTYIFGVIPSSIPAGTGYRIRVVSTLPVVTATDNGTDITISNTSAPTVPFVSINGPTDFCFGSATTFLTSSSSSNNLWFPGGTNTNPFIGVVSSGCYYTQIQSGNGCQTNSVPICINVNTPIFTFLAYFENGAIASTADTTITICEGDSAEIGILIEGGVAPFDISYTSDGITNTTVDNVGTAISSNTHTYSFFTSQPGIFQTIGVTDNFPTNCGSNGSSGTVIVQTAPLPVTSFSYEPFCGTESGAPVAAPGFLGGGTYSFDPLPSDGAAINPITGVLSSTVIGATYSVKYSVNGPFCEANSTVTVTVDSSDIVAFTIEPFCSSSSSSAPITESGFAGGGIYSFLATPFDQATINAVNGIISNASALTTYNIVYISPVGACQTSDTSSVTTLESPVLTGTAIDSECGESTGSIDVTVTSGLAPYSIIWSNLSTTEDLAGLAAGVYTVTVTDAQDCAIDSAFTIINSNQPELVFDVTDATCGETNGAISLTINNGVGPYEILWTPGDITSEDLTSLAAGIYSVEVTDLGSTCEVAGSATVNFEGAPQATFVAENSLCGQSIGSIDLTVTGGTNPIAHSWSNGETVEDISNLIAATYTDTISDANGCSTIVSVNIINENQFTLSSTVVNPTCADTASGSIDLTVNGGDSPFSFNWTPNNTNVTEDITGLTAGSYQVVVTDNAGCIDSLTSSIQAPPSVTATAVITDAACGQAIGSIDVTIAGGSGSYIFLWSTGADTEDVSGLAAGVYQFAVSDSSDNSCSITQSFTIVNGNEPELVLTSTGTSCTANTGTVSLQVNEGSGDFSYAWSGPNGFVSSVEDLTGLASGNYVITLTDNSTTCEIIDSISVDPANAPEITAVVANTTCGQNNGLIDIEIEGGTEPFTITWNGATSTIDQINLSAGSYSLEITDANNCQFAQTYTVEPSVEPTLTSEFLNPSCGNDTGSVNVSILNATNAIIYNWTKDGAEFSTSEDIVALSPAQYVLVASDAAGCVLSDTFLLVYQNQPTLAFTAEPAVCGEPTGSINLTVSSGTAPFVYQWTGANGFTASTEDLTGLTGACYDVIVTDSLACVATLQACVPSFSSPQTDLTITQPSCGEANGSIAPIVTGGLAPYTFEWSGTSFSVDSLFDNLGEGTYFLSITDANGCVSNDTVTLINSGIPVLTANIDDPECGTNDGSISLTASGGTAPYSYLWTPGGSSDSTISNLAIGTYSVQVTDASGCVASGQYSLVNLNGPAIASSVTSSLCGESNGGIDIIVTEGSGDYSYNWTGNGVVADTEDQTNLSAGAYIVLVTDVTSGCQATSTITIDNSNLPVLNLVSVGTLCGANSGSVELTVSNAVNPTFSWVGPDGFTSTSEDISDLNIGVYTVTVTDGNCEISGSVTVSLTKSVWSQNVNINAGSQYNFQMFAQNVVANSPAQLRVFVGANNLGLITPTGLATWSQFNASFIATTSGLTEVKIVNQNLSPSGNDFGIDDLSLIEVCPAVPPIGSNCGTNIIVNGDFEAGNSGFLSQYTFVANGAPNNELIPEGLYSVAPSGNAVHPQFVGTGRTGNFMIVNGNEPENPVLSFSTVGASCSANNGSINLTVTNFTTPISYQWSGPNGFSATTQDVSGLASGLYTVTVNSGVCSQVGSATVGFSNLPEVAFTAVPSDCGADNGSIDLTLSNTTNPTVSWVGPNGFVSTFEDLANLEQGSYIVTVSDAACIVSDTVVITTNEPLVAFAAVPTSCSAPIGSIDLTITNAIDPSISWVGPDGFTATNEDISELAEGTYVVTVTDGECVVVDSVTVISNAPLLALSSTPSACGLATGSIDLTITDSTSPLVNWVGPNGFTAATEDLTLIASGVYTVTVTDGDCIVVDSIEVITDEPVLVLNTLPTVCGISTGSIDITITNSVSPVYSWSGPNGFTATTEDITGLAAGIYTVTVTDGLCSVEDSIEVTVTGSSISATLTSVGTTCGLCNGTAEVTVNSGQAPFTFVWSSGESVFNPSALCAGDAIVTITDAGGCTSDFSVSISASVAPAITFTQEGSTCGASTGSIDLTVADGQTPYSYSWTGPNGFTATTEDISNIEAGSYTVEVLDASLCSVSATITITNTDSPVLSFIATNTTCGASAGAIDLILENTTAPTFIWTGPNSFTATTEDITGLSAGTYSVTITDGLCTATGTQEITNTDGPTATLSLSNDTICNGTDVILTLQLTGVAPFTFNYNDGTLPVTVTAFDGTTYLATVTPSANTTFTVTSIISDANPTCTGSIVNGTASVVVNPIPAQPTITANGSLIFCEGGSVILTSSSQINNFWNITGPDQLNQSITVTTSGAYSVAVVNSFGCADTSESVVVEVLPSGQISANNDTTVCAGSVLQFNATGGSNYVWSPSIYLSGTIIANPVCIPFETTTYVVTGSSTCGSGSDTILVTVNPIVDTDLGEDITVCQNETLVLSVENVVGASYTWGPANAIIGSDSAAIATINTNAATEVYVQTTNTNGCVFSDTVQVNITIPIATFNIVANGPTTFCEGESLVLQASTGNLVVWSNGLQNFDQILVTESGSYSAIYNGGNCPSYSDTIIVTVTPAPAIEILAQGSTTICDGNCLTLNASETANITWTSPGGATSTNATLQACTSGWYFLERTENGCTGIDSILISVAPAVTAPIVTLDGSNVLCEGQTTATLTSSYAIGNQWFLDGNPIAGETSSSIEVSDAGSYTVVVTSPEGCSAISTPVGITVKPLVPIDITAADTVVCNNEVVNIDLSATGGFVSYFWDITGETTSTITAINTGIFTVTGTSEDGCSSTASIQIINNLQFELNLSSPVFFDDYNVSAQGANDGSIDLTVFDGSGNFTYDWSNGGTTADLSGLAGGVYSVNVTDEQGCTVTDSITLKEPAAIKLPNGFTPNGDGFNDFYVIKGIQGYPGNKVNIFNRWGNLVYSTQDYQNNWSGVSNDGNLLPDGTYFIVVDLNKEGTDNVKNYIDLRRN